MEVCVRCFQPCHVPRPYSEYRASGPRPEWGPYYRAGFTVSADPAGFVSDSGPLYVYVKCQPSCKVNAAVARVEEARRELTEALLVLQSALVEAPAEYGDAEDGVLPPWAATSAEE